MVENISVDIRNFLTKRFNSEAGFDNLCTTLGLPNIYAGNYDDRITTLLRDLEQKKKNHVHDLFKACLTLRPEFVKEINTLFQIQSNEECEFELDAWRKYDLEKLYTVLIDYYKDINDDLFSYPHKEGKKVYVPLLVKDEWKNLTTDSLDMQFNYKRPTYTPSKKQKAFWNFFNFLKNGKLFDTPVFRLREWNFKENKLHLDFIVGEFSHTVMSQYILEHELVTLLYKKDIPDYNDFKIRNTAAQTIDMMQQYFRNNVCRIGINTLILLRKNAREYVPLVKRRSMNYLLHDYLLDQISSCIFGISTTPGADFNLKHTVLREIYEELFDKPEIRYPSMRSNPQFFYEFDGIKDLITCDSQHFEVTGFCIDLVRIVPEITLLYIIRDETYFKTYHNETNGIRFEINDEFINSSFFNIPVTIDDVDDFFMHTMITDPDQRPEKKGFDPLRWTLPGGFCFYQGLKRAIQKDLLT